MAVSSIDWNSLARRAVSPGAGPSRGTTGAAFRLDQAEPDPRPRAAEARARDDVAAAEERSDRIASGRARAAASDREAAQARRTAKADADARSAQAGDARSQAASRPRAAGAEPRDRRDTGRAAPDRTPARKTDGATRPEANPGQDPVSGPEESAATGSATEAGKTARTDGADKSDAAAPTPQAGMSALVVPLPTAPPPSALASAAQGAATAQSGESNPAGDPPGPPAMAVAAGPGPDAAAAAPHGLTVHARTARGDGSETGDPGAGKPQGDGAATFAPASDATARTDLAPAAAPAAGPAPTKAAEATAPTTPGAPAPAPVPLGAVPMTIGLRSLSGSNQFEIRLDPKDLGRIDVNLDIDKETGTVQARLVVDRPETLALLQRDAGNLQQALAQAGLNAGDGSINLSLRGDSAANGQSNGSGTDGQGSDPRGGQRAGTEATDPISPAAIPLRRYGAVLGIDIRI